MRKLTIVLIILWLFDVSLAFLAPQAASVSRYGLSISQANLLRFTILLPLLFIWLTALFSVVKFGHYAKMIEHAPEGDGFKKLTRGLTMLLLVIVLPSFVTAFANFYPDSYSVQQISTIIRNYLTLLLYLLGFWYLWKASSSLQDTAPNSGVKESTRNYVLSFVAFLSIVYVWAVFQNQFRSISSDAVVRPTYYLNDGLILFTIVIPYIIVWLLGSLTIMNIRQYSRAAEGLIYKEIFSSVAYGLTFTISLLIGLQFLSQANATMSHSALKIILTIIYFLLLAIAVGYLLIARGARKLTAIEEVK